MKSIKTIQDLADFEDWLHQQAGGFLPEQLAWRYRDAISDLIPLAKEGLRVGAASLGVDGKAMLDQWISEGGIQRDPSLGYLQAGIQIYTDSLRSRVKELEEALSGLLTLSENADETGYVDGEGWLPIERIQQRAHDLLSTRRLKEEAP